MASANDLKQCRVCDEASQQALDKAARDGIETSFARLDAQGTQCGFGRAGTCCRLCYMGPCRITKRAPRGVCGANEDTIVARNFLREVAGGVAAHSDHARHLVLLLAAVARGQGGDYRIRDERALRRTARQYGIDEPESSAESVALKLSERLLLEFTEQRAPLQTLALAPAKQQGNWQSSGVAPTGIDRMLVEAMHRTHMGVDQDYRSLMRAAFRASLADGWGGSRIGTAVSDILFGTPSPIRGAANLGVLAADAVNVLVHGHDPELSEMLAIASTEPDIVEAARAVGAKGVNLAGICCTANEILMRHGIPIAGNFLQQELAIVTGAVEMMIIDVQCCMPSLPDVARAYHTEIISTSDTARTPGAEHMPFDTATAMDAAKRLLQRAIDNYQHRDPAKVAIPNVSRPLVAGFSVEAIKYMLGGTFRASFRPLNDAVMQGRIRGIVGIVGCNNPKQRQDAYINTLTRELIRHDVLVLKTGCAAIASAKAGMLTPEAALEYAGPGLKEVCEAVGMPPVLHMGSCVDNSRILDAASEVVRERGLGDDLSQIPAVGVAPEWMSEKAVAIGCYFVASGVDVILGHPFHVSGSGRVERFLGEDARELFGASFHVCEDAELALSRILELLDGARERLGINQRAERKLYDMNDRRQLDV